MESLQNIYTISEEHNKKMKSP